MSAHRTDSSILAAIRAALVAQGRTPYWLARQIGMSPGGIYAILAGKRDIRISTLERMLAALRLTIKEYTKFAFD